MNGTVHLRICVLKMLPWLDVVVQKNGRIQLGAVLGKLLQLISSKRNITYDLLIPKDNEWGQKRPNGTWTGMIGMIHRNEADMILGPFAMTYDRHNALDLTEPYYTSSVLMVAGGPSQSVEHVFNFFSTFSLEVWVILGIFVALVVSVLNIFDRHPLNDDRDNYVSKDYMNFWTILGSLFSEASNSISPRLPSRFLLGVWLLGVLVLVNYFTGQMMAAMTIEQPVSRIESISDLVTKSSRPAKLPRGTAFADIFQYGYSDEYQEVWRRAVTTNGVQLMSHLLSPASFQEVKDGHAVTISEGTTLRFAVSRVCASLSGQGEIYFASERLFSSNLAMALRKNAPELLPALQIFSQSIRWTRAMGIIDDWLSKEYGTWQCNRDGDNRETTMTTKEFFSFMILWAFSLAISCVAFLCELINYHFIHNKTYLKFNRRKIQ